MQAADLKLARTKRGWSQEDLAKRVGLSQPYVSLVERGARPVSSRVASRLKRVLGEAPAEQTDPPVPPDELARNLSGLGYEPYAYLKARSAPPPERVLLGALRNADLDPRLTEALPWLATLPKLDWDWLAARVRLHDLQNRLGYVVELGRQVAERQEKGEVAKRLRGVEQALEPSILAREDTLCRESMTAVERDWLRESRPPAAVRWRVLSDLRLEHLPYAS